MRFNIFFLVFSQKVSEYNCLIEWNSIFILSFFFGECIKNETRQNGKCGRFYVSTAWNGIGFNRHKNAWLLISTFINAYNSTLICDEQWCRPSHFVLFSSADSRLHSTIHSMEFNQTACGLRWLLMDITFNGCGLINRIYKSHSSHSHFCPAKFPMNDNDLSWYLTIPKCKKYDRCAQLLPNGMSETFQIRSAPSNIRTGIRYKCD